MVSYRDGVGMFHVVRVREHREQERTVDVDVIPSRLAGRPPSPLPRRLLPALRKAEYGNRATAGDPAINSAQTGTSSQR
jgi:hypothetical protein